MTISPTDIAKIAPLYLRTRNVRLTHTWQKEGDPQFTLETEATDERARGFAKYLQTLDDKAWVDVFYAGGQTTIILVWSK